MLELLSVRWSVLENSIVHRQEETRTRSPLAPRHRRPSCPPPQSTAATGLSQQLGSPATDSVQRCPYRQRSGITHLAWAPSSSRAQRFINHRLQPAPLTCINACAWICIANTCLVTLPVSSSWLLLFLIIRRSLRRFPIGHRSSTCRQLGVP